MLWVTWPWCYNDDEKECEKNGRLYDATSSKDACPKGWHLSTDKEWQSLIAAYGGYNSKSNSIKDPKRTYIALLPGGASGFNAALEGHRNYDGKFIFKGILPKYQLILSLKFQGGYFFMPSCPRCGSQTLFAHFKKY